MNTYNIPEGYKFLGKHVGIKKKSLDFGIIFSDRVCNSAAAFTKNAYCGVSIPIGRDCLKNNELNAIVVTSGIANVATGQVGEDNARRIMKSISNQLCVSAENVLPSSTGVIGPQLPIDLILSKTSDIESELSSNKLSDFANAIRTTDKIQKIRSKKIGGITITGIAKGSGMIEPNMATMLVYILTDAKIEKGDIYQILKCSVDKSFNKMSIDTDTSTSDTVVLMANGINGSVNPTHFQEALDQICIELVEDILHDAEGATHLLTVKVKNAITKEDAEKIGKSVINSPLVKTSIFGNDPNWGRLIMAIGKTGLSDLKFEKLTIFYGDLCIFTQGQSINENILLIRDYLLNNKDIDVTIDLGIGNKSCTVFGCDLTNEYVEFNSCYST